eukprot:8448101-Pyramimonas_sp.AAC.1
MLRRLAFWGSRPSRTSRGSRIVGLSPATAGDPRFEVFPGAAGQCVAPESCTGKTIGAFVSVVWGFARRLSGCIRPSVDTTSPGVRGLR